jgi:hypothetical protein
MELIFEQIWKDYAEFIEKAEEFIKTRKEKELENGKDKSILRNELDGI